MGCAVCWRGCGGCVAAWRGEARGDVFRMGFGVCVVAWCGLGSLETACAALRGLLGFLEGEARRAGSRKACGGWMVPRGGEAGAVPSWKAAGGWAGSAGGWGGGGDSQLPLVSALSARGAAG